MFKGLLESFFNYRYNTKSTNPPSTKYYNYESAVTTNSTDFYIDDAIVYTDYEFDSFSTLLQESINKYGKEITFRYDSSFTTSEDAASIISKKVTIERHKLNS